MANLEIKPGDRVLFTYKGEGAFSGHEMTGEVITVDETTCTVYRDQPWRLADATATRLPLSEISEVLE